MNYCGRFVIEKDDGKGNLTIKVPRTISDFPDKRNFNFDAYAFWQADDTNFIMKPVSKDAKKNLKEVCKQLEKNYVGARKRNSDELVTIKDMLLSSFNGCILVCKNIV